MSAVLDLWRGDLGDQYHQRNRFDPDQIRPFFQRILLGTHREIDSILEIGCGNGHNLAALDGRNCVVAGVEPNQQARMEAQALGLPVCDGEITDLVFANKRFDLVMTCGVLIHVPPADIGRAMDEVVRVARRYVLAVEYHAPVETEVPYRGHRDVLWKRPYRDMYEQRGLRFVQGDLADHELFPGCAWWLMHR